MGICHVRLDVCDWLRAVYQHSVFRGCGFINSQGCGAVINSPMVDIIEETYYCIIAPVYSNE